MILIVTQRLDPHVDLVESALDARGLPWIRLHLSDIPHRISGAFEITKETTRGRLALPDRDLDVAEVRTVWYRRTEQPNPGPFEDDEYDRFASAECRAFIKSLWSCLRHAHWISAPRNIRDASDKYEQLVRAQALGFSVPATCMSNNPADVKSFVATIGEPHQVIYKPYTSLIVANEDGTSGVAYATQLAPALIERLHEIKTAPGIFQERIAKRRDIRVTVFGDRVFAVAIDSQSRRSSENDFRAADWNDAPLQHTLLKDFALEGMCRDLVRSYGLEYGAIDLVEDKDGKFWFLEINPNGQWAWQERLIGIPMHEALVDLFQRGKQ